MTSDLSLSKVVAAKTGRTIYYYYYYLLCKLYQGTQKIMQKSTKKEKKTYKKSKKTYKKKQKQKTKNLTRCKYSSHSFVHPTYAQTS